MKIVFQDSSGWSERGTVNADVAGSNPAPGANILQER